MVTVVSISEQAEISTYNEENLPLKKIPIVARNGKTGWPLLQVSLFAEQGVDASGEPLYGHVLGGGDCHRFNIGAFFLATLLMSVPGGIQLNVDDGPRRKRAGVGVDLFTADHVGSLLHGYRFEHLKYKVSISSVPGYGAARNLEVGLPTGLSPRLASALGSAFHRALRSDLARPIQDMAMGLMGFFDERSFRPYRPYTETELRDAVNKEIAIFSEGQIYIDLGFLLKDLVEDPEITELFSHLFKVEEYLSLKPVVVDAVVPTPERTGLPACSFFSLSPRVGALLTAGLVATAMILAGKRSS